MKQLKMHRALGGAPVSPVQWRSLGRSLLANAVRVRRGSPLQQEKNSHSRRASSLQFYLTLKTNFLGRSSSAMPQLTQKDSRDAALLRLSLSIL